MLHSIDKTKINATKQKESIKYMAKYMEDKIGQVFKIISGINERNIYVEINETI